MATTPAACSLQRTPGARFASGYFSYTTPGDTIAIFIKPFHFILSHLQNYLG
jgi:hypothetical protein